MRNATLVLIAIASFASMQADASWGIDCALEGRVLSEPQAKYSKQQRTHFIVFNFEVSKSEALVGTYLVEDCANRIGKTFVAEVLKKRKLPKFAIGDLVRLRYRYLENKVF